MPLRHCREQMVNGFGHRRHFDIHCLSTNIPHAIAMRRGSIQIHLSFDKPANNLIALKAYEPKKKLEEKIKKLYKISKWSETDWYLICHTKRIFMSLLSTAQFKWVSIWLKNDCFLLRCQRIVCNVFSEDYQEQNVNVWNLVCSFDLIWWLLRIQDISMTRLPTHGTKEICKLNDFSAFEANNTSYFTKLYIVCKFAIHIIKHRRRWNYHFDMENVLFYVPQCGCMLCTYITVYHLSFVHMNVDENLLLPSSRLSFISPKLQTSTHTLLLHPSRSLALIL